MSIVRQKLSQDMEVNPVVEGFAMPVDEIDELTIEEMRKQGTVERLADLVAETRFNNDLGDGSEIYRKLNKKLGEFKELREEREIYPEYEDILKYLAWFTLPLRSDDELRAAMKNYLLFGLKTNIDLADKIQSRLEWLTNDIANLSERQLMINSLKENEERLSQERISVSAETERKLDMVKNWIVDYDRFINKLGSRADVERVVYINQSANARKLNQEDKETLLKILKIYDFLRFVPVIPGAYQEQFSTERRLEGIVEKILPREKARVVPPIELKIPIEADSSGSIRAPQRSAPVYVPKEISAGKEPAVERPAVAESSTQILQAKYSGFLGRDLMKNVWLKEEQLKVETGNDLKALRNKFYHAVNNGQKEEAMAALLALTENGQIRAIFGEDERFVKFWGNYLEKHYGSTASLRSDYGASSEKNTSLSSPAAAGLDTSPKLGEEDVVVHFKNDPAGAKFLAMFFKYILEERLKINVDDAVMIGMAMANLARRAGELEYQEMAYGDMESGEFRWNC